MDSTDKYVTFTEKTFLIGGLDNSFQTLSNGFVCKRGETFFIWKMMTGRFSISVNSQGQQKREK